MTDADRFRRGIDSEAEKQMQHSKRRADQVVHCQCQCQSYIYIAQTLKVI